MSERLTPRVRSEPTSPRFAGAEVACIATGQMPRTGTEDEFRGNEFAQVNQGIIIHRVLREKQGEMDSASRALI